MRKITQKQADEVINHLGKKWGAGRIKEMGITPLKICDVYDWLTDKKGINFKSNHAISFMKKYAIVKWEPTKDKIVNGCRQLLLGNPIVKDNIRL